MNNIEILYVADPMCSWCYGFADVLQSVHSELPSDARLRYVMGGLAPDSDEPMPAETRAMVQAAWAAVERATGAPFNHAFWTDCAPRRSTWPACRAVIAAERSRAGLGTLMFEAIQRAYYREARNPSDDATLCELAVELGLERTSFAADLNHPDVVKAFAADRQAAAAFGAAGYPTLLVVQDGKASAIARGWTPLDRVQQRIASLGLA